MHIRPSRIESDEVVFHLRRIEEQLGELIRSVPTGKRPASSGLVEKLMSLATAEEEAAKLLRVMNAEAAVRQLMMQGYGTAMAETAVARAGGPRVEST